MRVWLAIALCCVSLVAKDQVEITAKNFVADESKGETVITGDVVVVRGSDKLTSDSLVVFFDKKNRPQKYEAHGSVKFNITLQDGRKIKGSSKSAIYDPSKNEYHLLGDALVEEIGKENIARGEKIVINRVSGFANVSGGSKAPARLIFTFEESTKGAEKDSPRKETRVKDK